MAVYTIPFTGIIGSPEDENDKEVYFSLHDLIMHLHNAAAFDAINIAINSKGGYCDKADKMIALIQETGKHITTCNTGIVASAATKIFTIPSLENRTYHPERGEFLIHNPWATIDGDAQELANAAKSMKSVEDEYVKWYAKQTGTDANIISALMTENIPLTAEQVEKFGFAKINIKQPVQAVAYLQTKIKNTMNDEQVKAMKIIVEGEGNKILNSIKELFKGKAKAIMLTDGGGNELEFPECNDPSEVVVGVKVNIKGQPVTEKKSFTMPDGTIITAENGTVTEIMAASTEVEALKKQVEDLQAQLATKETALQAKEQENVRALAVAKEAKEHIESIQSQFSDFNFRAQTKTPKTGDDTKPKTKAIISKEELEKI